MSQGATSSEPRLVVITGLSGSGKSTAIRALEDIGYYCIDNLPAVLLERVLELVGDGSHVGLVIDMRSQPFLDDAPAVLERIQADGVALDLLFLDANDETLVRRFSETRRKHPASGTSVRDGIREERERLHPMLELAGTTIDTSRLTPHDLKRVITARYAPSRGDDRRVALTVMSFGFKHGVPPEADLVFDVRFLPNPFFDPALRDQRGIHDDVSSFVMRQPAAQGFLERVFALLDYALPHYEQEGKRYLTVAIGCTGGHHRSVAMACRLHTMLSEAYPDARVDHRDIAR